MPASLPDLRERRRLATQAEIETAALALFERHGCEGTTVDDIAAAAGISARTFFRYFPTKEAAALGGNHAFDTALAERLSATVPGTADLAGVEAAIEGALRRLAVDDPESASRMLRVRCLAIEDVALRTAAHRMDVEHAHRFLQRVVHATGASGLDLRTRVITETLIAGLRTALDEWASRREAGEDVDLADVYRATCALLREVVGAPGGGGALPDHHSRETP
ncbi:MAG: TetR family transcriptional regulator [Janthinobacterium lividum]